MKAILKGRRCLVIGLGPIGLLVSVAITLRGGAVYGCDVVDEGSPGPEWLKAMGGAYIDGRKIRPQDLEKAAGGKFGLIYQAAGAVDTAFGALNALAPNGAFIFFAAGRGKTEVDGELVRKLITVDIKKGGSSSLPEARSGPTLKAGGGTKGEGEDTSFKQNISNSHDNVNLTLSDRSEDASGRISFGPEGVNIADGNNTLIGSISSSRWHFDLAIKDLERASLKWKGHIERLINKRYRHSVFERGIKEHQPQEIKAVVDWE